MFYKVQETFIVGNFFEVEEETVSTPINQIMVDSKRLPECVIHLKIQDNDKYLQRVFDRASIEREHAKVMQERKEQRQKEKELARQEALANLEEGQELPPEEEEGEDDDPDAPLLSDKIAEKTEQLVARKDKDQESIDQFLEQMAELKIPITTIDAERPVENVFLELCYHLKPFLFRRNEKLEARLATAVPEEQLKNYEKSLVYKKSRYGNLSPLDLFSRSLQFPVLYRDRIYYAENSS